MTKYTLGTTVSHGGLPGCRTAVARNGSHVWIARRRSQCQLNGHGSGQRHDRRHRASDGQPHDHPDEQQFSEIFHTHIKTSLARIGSRVTMFVQQRCDSCWRYASGAITEPDECSTPTITIISTTGRTLLLLSSAKSRFLPAVEMTGFYNDGELLITPLSQRQTLELVRITGQKCLKPPVNASVCILHFKFRKLPH